MGGIYAHHRLVRFSHIPIGEPVNQRTFVNVQLNWSARSLVVLYRRLYRMGNGDGRAEFLYSADRSSNRWRY
jgi:hypothetical protein